MEREREFKKIILEAEQEAGRQIPISYIVQKAEKKGISAVDSEMLICNLIKKGDLFEPRKSIVQRVDDWGQ